MKVLILYLSLISSVLAYEGSVPWEADKPKYPADKAMLEQIKKCSNVLYGSIERNEKDFDEVFKSFCLEISKGYIGA